MTVVIEIRFPLGRYHATPWDRHVNEGVVEWPPSAWRLARALYSVWKGRAPHLDEKIVLAALDSISAPPTYLVPAVTEMATRHMYPDADHRSGLAKPSSDKILDGSVVIPADRAVYLLWDSEVSGSAQSALDELLDLLPYLGRAESVCTARLIPEGQLPESDGYHRLEPGSGGELTLPSPRRPLDIDELTITTDVMRRRLLSRPPGTAWTAYAAPPRVRSALARPVANPRRPTAVLFSLAGRPLPSYTLAAAVGDVAAKAAVARWGDVYDRPSRILSGHDPDGTPAGDETRQHRHAHYLPLPEKGTRSSGKIDRLLVWAPDGFDLTELDAISGLTWLAPRQRPKNHEADGERSAIRGFNRVRCMVAAVGCDELLEATGVRRTRPARRWTSLTPFATVRHEHRRRYGPERLGQFSAGFIAEEINRELRHRQLPSATISEAAGPTPTSRYWRRRSTDPLARSLPAVWVDLLFDEPVAGPVSLGALSHFGLGLFRPIG